MQRRIAMYASPTLTPRWAYPDGDDGGGGGGGDDAAAKAAAAEKAAADAKAAAEKAAADKAAANKSGGTDDEYDFPDNTPLAEMTPQQVAEYWRHKARKHETTVKARSDYDDLKAKADQYDALSAASRTEHEQAIEAAKAEAREQAKKETLPGLVRAELRAEAKGRIEAEQLDSILEPIDLTKFLTDTGEVDTEKVSKFIDGIAPANGAGGGTFPGLGQGRRGSGGKASGVAAGKDLYAESHAST